MFKKFVANHVLANLTFLLILMLGMFAYFSLIPRAKDPEINFNWINVNTALPGASASDVEKRVTDPLEEAIGRTVQDIDFVSSTSREGSSNLLVRFNDIDDQTFNKRISDLRREVQNTYTDQLPDEATDPFVLEITTSSAFPTASILVKSQGGGENLRSRALTIKKRLERLKGVDSVTPSGLYDPELHVVFYPDRLDKLGVTSADIADTIRQYFRDVSIGDLTTRNGNWIISLVGTDSDPERLAGFPILTAQGVVPLSSLADIYRATREADQLVSYKGQPAVVLGITKTADANILDLVETMNEFVAKENQLKEISGIELVMVDDQTDSTKSALSVMTNNMLLGLFLVMLVTWAFLGSRIAFFTCMGIPFSLAGTFIVLYALDMTINNMVLLGVVISLGMLVDDAVVVVEAIYFRISRGMNSLEAVVSGVKEVFSPVTASVLTTIAAFLPLAMMQGIMGEFMRIAPITVTVALLVSLIEAFWMLPSHISGANVSMTKKSKIQAIRSQYTRKLRLKYTQLLIKAMRRPLATTAIAIAIVVIGLGSLRFVDVNFFTFDPVRNFYVNIEMPAGATLEETLAEAEKIEQIAYASSAKSELRSAVSFSGLQFTQTEPLYGENVGQVQVSLYPKKSNTRTVTDIAAQVIEKAQSAGLSSKITLLEIEDGPPTGKPISLKLLGSNYADIKLAADALTGYMGNQEIYENTTIDYRPGNPQLQLKHDGEAIKRAGLSPSVVTRALQAHVDGELVSEFQNNGENVWVRLLAKSDDSAGIDQLLRQTVSRPDGSSIALGDLMTVEYGTGQRVLRHHNFQRAITVEADINNAITDTLDANNQLKDAWEEIRLEHPGIGIDFSGELDDIEESMKSMLFLFVIGLGLIYIILGTQFKSYVQPILILATIIPLSISGVFIGLAITGNPLSMYTLYGMIALVGIAVNSAIVLVSAANQRLDMGMSTLHAIVYAARRRVIPVVITTATTVAGLLSLAVGIAGKSLMWGPIATAIVFGLSISSALTLFVLPLLYRGQKRAAASIKERIPLFVANVRKQWFCRK